MGRTERLSGWYNPPSQNYRNGSGAINAKLRFTLCIMYEAVVEQVKAAAEDQTHTPG